MIGKQITKSKFHHAKWGLNKIKPRISNRKIRVFLLVYLGSAIIGLLLARIVNGSLSPIDQTIGSNLLFLGVVTPLIGIMFIVAFIFTLLVPIGMVYEIVLFIVNSIRKYFRKFDPVNVEADRIAMVEADRIAMRRVELTTIAKHLPSTNSELSFGLGELRGYSNGDLRWRSVNVDLRFDLQLKSWGRNNPITEIHSENLYLIDDHPMVFEIPKNSMNGWEAWLRNNYLNLETI